MSTNKPFWSRRLASEAELSQVDKSPTLDFFKSVFSSLLENLEMLGIALKRPVLLYAEETERLQYDKEARCYVNLLQAPLPEPLVLDRELSAIKKLREHGSKFWLTAAGDRIVLKHTYYLTGSHLRHPYMRRVVELHGVTKTEKFPGLSTFLRENPAEVERIRRTGPESLDDVLKEFCMWKLGRAAGRAAKRLKNNGERGSTDLDWGCMLLAGILMAIGIAAGAAFNALHGEFNKAFIRRPECEKRMESKAQRNGDINAATGPAAIPSQDDCIEKPGKKTEVWPLQKEQRLPDFEAMRRKPIDFGRATQALALPPSAVRRTTAVRKTIPSF